MNRRQFLMGAAVAPILAGCAQFGRTSAEAPQRFRRVRPGDQLWPSEAQWDTLRQAVHGRLIKLESPLAACRAEPDGAYCTKFFKELKNPYYIGDQPALTQTSGWVDAWTSAPSVFAVAAEE
ncbi:MAG TPA: FAD-linked oxidoreductase, partial [Rhodothermia bacterium]